MEKIPKNIQKPPEEREQAQTVQEGIERPVHQVEDVVAHVNEVHSACCSNPERADGVSKVLHEEINGTEIGDFYRKYEKHELLTLEDISKTVRSIGEIVGEEMRADGDETPEVVETLKLLESRELTINSSARSYLETLIRFFNLKRQRGRLDESDFLLKMEEIDHRRRRAHDMLIGSLEVYKKAILKIKEQGFLEKYEIVDWDVGMVPRKLSSNAITVFSDGFLTNRERVKDWAISARLHFLMEEIERLENENGGTATSDSP